MREQRGSGQRWFLIELFIKFGKQKPGHFDKNSECFESAKNFVVNAIH